VADTISATQDQIHGTSGSDYSNGVNGLDAWSEEGIAGRGVLVDYLDYAERHGISFEKTRSHQIHVKDVVKILEETGTVPQVGDILFLRTGFVRGYMDLKQDQREAMKSERQWPGLVQSQESAEWLWERQFSAVAADNPAFECGREYLLSYLLCYKILY
jgi:kynurenine formamidase